MKNRIIQVVALFYIFGCTLPAFAATHYKAKLDQTTHLGIVANPMKVATDVVHHGWRFPFTWRFTQDNQILSAAVIADAPKDGDK